MALPASGQLSIDAIRIELGIPSDTNLTMSGFPKYKQVDYEHLMALLTERK